MCGDPSFASLNKAFAFYNQRLFAGGLSGSVITVQRQRGAHGFFRPNSFQRRNAKARADEIGLNPEGFDRDDVAILSSLVHEMAHKWQEQHGKPSRNGYHNRQWANKMESLGLMPSDTGVKGGKRTGQKMSHYVIYQGVFKKETDKLLKIGFKLDWKGLIPPKKKSKNSKMKYQCTGCAQNAWAKPEAKLVCGNCLKNMDAIN